MLRNTALFYRGFVIVCLTVKENRLCLGKYTGKRYLKACV